MLTSKEEQHVLELLSEMRKEQKKHIQWQKESQKEANTNSGCLNFLIGIFFGWLFFAN